jgi:hypothetical protein
MTAKAVESPPFTIDFAQVFEVSTTQPTPLPTTRAPHRSPIISNSSAVACTDRRVTYVQTKMSKAQKKRGTERQVEAHADRLLALRSGLR